MTTIMHGVVRRVTTKGVYINLPRQFGETLLGPCLNTIGPLVEGDRIVVTAADGYTGEHVILARTSGLRVSDLTDASLIGRTLLTAPTAADARTAIDLGNVDNTADLAKPVSTAVQSALDALTYTSLQPAALIGTTVGGNDLNNFVSEGEWHQDSDITAGEGVNYPAPLAGHLRVRRTPSSGLIYQTYTTYTRDRIYAAEPALVQRIFNRVRQNNTWSPWRETQQFGVLMSGSANFYTIPGQYHRPVGFWGTNADNSLPATTTGAAVLNVTSFEPGVIEQQWRELGGRRWRRTTEDTGTTWTAWVEEFDVAPTLLTYMNNWTDFDSTTYARLKSSRNGTTVTVAGMPKPGTLTDGTQIATVPADHQPDRDVYGPCTIRNSTGAINGAGLAVVRRKTFAIPGALHIFGLTSSTAYVNMGFSYHLNGA